MDNLYNKMKHVPVLGQLLAIIERRPRISAWVLLSAGIILMLLVEARDVGLLIGQWLALMIASIIVSGLCIWIVSWEDTDEDVTEPLAKAAPVVAAAAVPAGETPSVPAE